ncbi:MAG: hypothetical protein GQ549_03565 [Gammaproteobacteria bacterium]|nr:hypothetical protein [Gammaproteobacteria bacterium]
MTNFMKKRYFFLKLAIPVALSFWFLDSFIHYFWYNESAFEIIPADPNDLWMRFSIFILLTSFGLFADFTSRKIIKKNAINSRTENISRAKKQWELVIDSLPQLVIAMDDNARIVRVNRTAETWHVGKVNKVDGLYVPDFLKCLNDDYTDDAWTSDWPYIWKQIKNKDTIERKIEKEHNGKIYHYCLRKVSDYDFKKDQCYAVLIIDDITARVIVERSLREYAQELEKNVNDRTLELKQINERLEQELQFQKQAKKALKESQECRIGLLRDLFNTQEIERKRIACELHDSIGQSLGATKFKIEELLMNKQNFSDDEYSQFNDLVIAIKGAIQEVRNIAMDLRPAMLDDLGTLPTLKWFCREYGNTYSAITVETLLNVDESDISEDKKVVIFRIVQEAMNNIAKHSNATKIVLELSKANSDMTMLINDNGCGFDMKAKSNKCVNQPGCNFGLNSMRERAESTNGKFTIDSTPDNGTSVIVSWKNKDEPALPDESPTQDSLLTSAK